MRREQQEIKNFIQEIEVKGVRAVIFPESFFFSPNNPKVFNELEDQSEIFKDFHLFIEIVKNLILRDIKIHVQANHSIQRRLDRFSIFEMICDIAAINRHRVLEYLMFYYDMPIQQITSRITKNLKPSFGINIVSRGIKTAKNFLSFNYKSNPSNQGLKPDEIAIVLDPSFSMIQREELFLGNFRVIELTIFDKKQIKHAQKEFKNIKNIVKKAEIKTEQKREEEPDNQAPRQTPVEEILRNIPSPTMYSRATVNEADSKYLIAKNIYDESLKIYNQLKHRSQEFSRSAVELKIKSDQQKEILENIESMIEKNLSGIDKRDLHDAKLQCQKEIVVYNQQCKDFFDLYVQISEQAHEAKQDLIRAEQELKKYLN